MTNKDKKHVMKNNFPTDNQLLEKEDETIDGRAKINRTSIEFTKCA